MGNALSITAQGGLKPPHYSPVFSQGCLSK